MKNVTVLLISALLMFSFTDKNKRSRKADLKTAEYTNVALDLVGHLENASFDFEHAKYRLYRDGIFVAGGTTDHFGTIELYLMKNSNYWLEFSCPGFLKKYVHISTHVPDDFREIGFFDFGTLLIPSAQLEEEDLCSMDAPYAYVYFNSIINEFEYHIEYTEKMIELEREIISQLIIP